MQLGGARVRDIAPDRRLRRARHAGRGAARAARARAPDPPSCGVRDGSDDRNCAFPRPAHAAVWPLLLLVGVLAVESRADVFRLPSLPRESAMGSGDNEQTDDVWKGRD